MRSPLRSARWVLCGRVSARLEKRLDQRLTSRLQGHAWSGILLEAMTGSVRELWSRWPAVLLVTLPGLVLSALWVLATGGEVAAWRMTHGTELPDDLFDPLRKLVFMLENPLHFPQGLINSMDYAPWILLQVIGVLGWLDTSLQALVCPTLALLLLPVTLGWNFDPRYRGRVALVAGASRWLTWQLSTSSSIWPGQRLLPTASTACRAATSWWCFRSSA
jgi:hypothetical protein